MWYIVHSAKGSEWEEHQYLQVIDGKYYYPDSYEGGRHLSLYKKKTEGSSGSSSSKSNSKKKPKAKLFDKKGIFNRQSLTDARNKAMGKSKSKNSSSSKKSSGSKKSKSGSSTSTPSPDSNSSTSKSAKRVEQVVSKIEANATNDTIKEKLSGTIGINDVITKYAKVSINSLDKSQISSIKKKLQKKYGGTYT